MLFVKRTCCTKLGHVAQQVACKIQEPEVPGSIPGHILSFLPPLIQEGQLSVSGQSMCMKYWLIA